MVIIMQRPNVFLEKHHIFIKCKKSKLTTIYMNIGKQRHHISCFVLIMIDKYYLKDNIDIDVDGSPEFTIRNKYPPIVLKEFQFFKLYTDRYITRSSSHNIDLQTNCNTTIKIGILNEIFPST